MQKTPSYQCTIILVGGSPTAISYISGRADDLAVDAASLRAGAASLEESLQGTLRGIYNLESQCSSLEHLVALNEAAVATRTDAHASHMQQITTALATTEEISCLQLDAAALKQSLVQVLP